MGKKVEYVDDEPVKMKKESKKNKNVADDDTLISGDDNSHVETDGDHLKKKKKDKHVEKKRKSDTIEDGETDGDTLKKKKDKHKEKKSTSESNEDGETDGDGLKKKKDKHKEKNSESESKEDGETDGDGLTRKKDNKEKKSKSESKEDGETDGEILRKKKDKHKEKKSESESKEDVKTDGGILKKKKKDKHKEKKGEPESKDVEETDGDGLKKKKKDKHKEKKSDSESKEDGDEDQHVEGKLVNDDSQKKNKKRKRKHSSEEAQVEENELDPKPEKKKKKTKKIDGQDNKAKGKAIESGENNTEKPKKKSKSKKVSFSGHVEVFPTSDTEPDKQTTDGDGLLRGKRFTPEEDEIVKKAVLDYVVEKGLGDDGLKMVLNCRSHKGMKKCWQEIGLCIPYRPYTAVYYRAHNLFERAETRTWTPEEFQLLREYHKKHGNDWKKLAAELGKHRFHVKDAWRRIKFENLKSGKWTQEEYQQLYDLVNLDLQMKINGEEKKKSKHGMLRDNIPWTAISEKLSTRTDATCCEKWYNQLTSSLVVEKKWADADDYRMIGVLYELDAPCIEDVEWDDILEHRPGEICLKRWHQMVKYIGDYRSKSFGEQVDILAQRYCPDLAETRETWDNKPLVD